jgi:hopene-associated glycosyltransferase HpnB
VTARERNRRDLFRSLLVATINDIDSTIHYVAGISLGIWLYLLLLHGMFWRVRPLLRKPPGPAKPARVAVVIPARDEAEVIGEALDSLQSQRFDGELRIFVIDDNSSDETGAIADARGATVLHAGPLPAGWTGKLWALSRGVEAATVAMEPDFLLLTDADIVHGPTSITDLVARDLPLASIMVKLRCESTAERLLVPAFVYFFFKLYPPAWIADPRAKTAGAAGGCILIKSNVLQKIGGIAAIRNELIDDCALAAKVKPYGPIWLGMSAETRSIRLYRTYGAIWNMVARTAFTQLRHSSLLLIGTAGGMSITYLAPVVLTLAGSWIAAAAYTLLCISYVPMLRFYGQPVAVALLLPAVALFYLGATIHSAIRYWLGKGGLWKGRVQDNRQ